LRRNLPLNILNKDDYAPAKLGGVQAVLTTFWEHSGASKPLLHASISEPLTQQVTLVYPIENIGSRPIDTVPLELYHTSEDLMFPHQSAFACSQKPSIARDKTDTKRNFFITKKVRV
jgi:hypothetical protein